MKQIKGNIGGKQT